MHSTIDTCKHLLVSGRGGGGGGGLENAAQMGAVARHRADNLEEQEHGADKHREREAPCLNSICGCYVPVRGFISKHLCCCCSSATLDWLDCPKIGQVQEGPHDPRWSFLLLPLGRTGHVVRSFSQAPLNLSTVSTVFCMQVRHMYGLVA